VAADHGRVAPPCGCALPVPPRRAGAWPLRGEAGGGGALGTQARTTAGCGRRCDRCRSGRVAAKRPPWDTPAAVPGGGDGCVALTRRQRRLQ